MPPDSIIRRKAATRGDILDISKQQYITNYWNYYCRLESQLIASQRYVEFAKSNKLVFSMEYLQISQAACNEVEVLAKIIAMENPIDSTVKYERINEWGYALQQYIPNISETEIVFYDLYSLKPWNKWKYDYFEKGPNKKASIKLASKHNNPFWWVAHNKVKHERTTKYKKSTNYSRANLLNTVNSMAALYFLEVTVQQLLNIDVLPSKLFFIKPNENNKVEKNEDDNDNNN